MTPEWLTISQAAAVMGISERQSRRYSKRLSEGDRREPDSMSGSSPALVRLSALIEIRNQAVAALSRPAFSPAMAGLLPHTQAGHMTGIASDVTSDPSLTDVRPQTVASEEIDHFRIDRELKSGEIRSKSLSDESPIEAGQTPEESSARVRPAPVTGPAHDRHMSGLSPADVRPESGVVPVADIEPLKRDIEQIKAFMAGDMAAQFRAALAELPHRDDIKAAVTDALTTVEASIGERVGEQLQTINQRLENMEGEAIEKRVQTAVADALKPALARLGEVAQENGRIKQERDDLQARIEELERRQAKRPWWKLGGKGE